MARVTFSELRDRIHLLVGNHSKISSDEIESIMEAEDEAICEGWQWQRRIYEATVPLTGVDSDTSTASVTVNSATVTFDSDIASSSVLLIMLGLAGTYIKFTGADEAFRIVSAYDSSAKTASLEVAWGKASLSSVAIELFKFEYPIVDFTEVIACRGKDGPLDKITMSEMLAKDPNFTTRGDPKFYAISHRPTVNSGDTFIQDRPIANIAFWPIPSSTTDRYPVFVKGLLAYYQESTANRIDTYPTELLRYKSVSSCAFILFSRTKDKHFRDLGDRYSALYMAAKKEAENNDVGRHDVPKRTKVSGGVYYDDDFSVDHDVSWRY